MSLYICLDPYKCTRPKVNSNGNYVNVGFIFDSKCTPLMRDVNNGGGYSCLEAGSMLEISIPFSQFFCKPIITLEKWNLLKRKKRQNNETKCITRAICLNLIIAKWNNALYPIIYFIYPIFSSELRH